MPISKVEFLQDAVDDLEELVEYIAKDNITEAEKMYKRVIDHAQELKDFPRRGMPVPDEKMKKSGWRMLFVPPYVLFYRIIDDCVVIYRIFHGASNYPALYDKFNQ